MIPNALSCKELVEIVTEYLEGTLSEADKARFEAHLAGCDGCRIYLEQMKLTIRWMGNVTEEQISEEAKERLLHAFRDWKTSKM